MILHVALIHALNQSNCVRFHVDDGHRLMWSGARACIHRVLSVSLSWEN